MTDWQYKQPLGDDGSILLNYAEIRRNLALPIPDEWISKYEKVKGSGTWLSYMNVYNIKDALTLRAGIWNVEIRNYGLTEYGKIIRPITELVYPPKNSQDRRPVETAANQHETKGQFQVALRLTIFAKDRNVFMDGNGHEDLPFKGFGDPFSNAYAMAFRRAAEGHEFARTLWRKSDKIEEETFEESGTGEDQEPRTQQRAPQQQTKPTDTPELTGEKANSGQLSILETYKTKGIDVDKISSNRYRKGTNELDEKQAQDLINICSKIRVKAD